MYLQKSYYLLWTGLLLSLETSRLRLTASLSFGDEFASVKA